MTPAESKRRARARRALRQYMRLVYGGREDIPGPQRGLVRRMFNRELRRSYGPHGQVF